MKEPLIEILLSKGSEFTTKDKSNIYLFAAGIPKATKIYCNCPLKHSDVDGVINDYVIKVIDNMGEPTTYAIFEQPNDSGECALRAIVYDDQYIEPGQATITMLSSILNGFDNPKSVKDNPLLNFDAFRFHDDELGPLVKAYNGIKKDN